MLATGEVAQPKLAGWQRISNSTTAYPQIYILHGETDN